MPLGDLAQRSMYGESGKRSLSTQSSSLFDMSDFHRGSIHTVSAMQPSGLSAIIHSHG